jgi:hypothetical protein
LKYLSCGTGGQEGKPVVDNDIALCSVHEPLAVPYVGFLSVRA